MATPFSTGIIPIQVNETEIHLWVSFTPGETGKRPVLGLHGNLQNSTSLDEILGFFTSKGHPTLTCDLPGHGHSAPYPKDMHPTMSTFADTIVQVLQSDAYPPIDHPILFGHSMGAFSILQYATEYPHHIGALVLISGADIDPVKVNPLLTHEGVKSSIDASYANFQCREKYHFGKELSEETIISVGFHCTDPRAYEQNMLATFHYDVREKLNQIQSFCLLIHGKQDQFITSEMMESMQKRLSNSHYEPLCGGHNVHLFRPQEVITMLKRHYDRLVG